MDLIEVNETAGSPKQTAGFPFQPASPDGLGSSSVTAQSCPSCGTARVSDSTASPANFVYALGRITPRFPTPSIAKEFSQVVGRDETQGLTDPQVFHKVLSETHNRYLVRKLCWVMTIEGLETYILLPRYQADYDCLIEAVREAPQPNDCDVVIGAMGPIAPPEMCNGLMVPIVAFDQIYSFDRDSLIKALPKPEKVPAKEFTPAAEQLFDRIMQMADNGGSTDEHRAVNYLAVRYHRIYEAVAEAFARNESLTSLDVRPSRLRGTRKVVDVIFSFTNRNTDVVSKQFVRVDVSEEFPFLFTKLAPYFEVEFSSSPKDNL